jgi:molybdenum cofactor cytidylyltransferase
VDRDPDVTGMGGIVLADCWPERARSGRGLSLVQDERPVHRAARAAMEAGLWPVVVVVGGEAEELRAALAGLPVVTAGGSLLGGGQARALRAGLERLLECAPAARGAVVLGCDPAGVEASHLRALAAACGGGRAAAACFAGRLGLPALFPAAHFPALRSLEGDVDALLARLSAEVAPVTLSLGNRSQ